MRAGSRNGATSVNQRLTLKIDVLGESGKAKGSICIWLILFVVARSPDNNRDDVAIWEVGGTLSHTQIASPSACGGMVSQRHHQLKPNNTEPNCISITILGLPDFTNSYIESYNCFGLLRRHFAGSQKKCFYLLSPNGYNYEKNWYSLPPHERRSLCPG